MKRHDAVDINTLHADTARKLPGHMTEVKQVKACKRLNIVVPKRDVDPALALQELVKETALEDAFDGISVCAACYQHSGQQHGGWQRCHHCKHWLCPGCTKDCTVAVDPQVTVCVYYCARCSKEQSESELEQDHEIMTV